jgi:hypothetical protein
LLRFWARGGPFFGDSGSVDTFFLRNPEFQGALLRFSRRGERFPVAGDEHERA